MSSIALSKMELILKDVLEVVTKDELLELIEHNKSPKSYWGIATTGPPHTGYYRAIAKQFDLINAGFTHRVLLADLHAYLDDQKSPWEETLARGKIYEICLRKLGLDENVDYVFGHDFQLEKKYISNLIRIMPLVTATRATRAASQVCRMESPKVSSLVYPLMQNLDCLGLDIDVAYGGIDQRHVYMLGREIFPKLSFKKIILLFTPLGLSLSGKEKMSASKKETRLELFASPERITKGITSAFCPPQNIENNPILEHIKFLIFPRITVFTIERERKYGGDITFSSYEQLEREYVKGGIHPSDLKRATSKYLIEVLKPIREYFERHNGMLEIFKNE